MRDRMSVEGVNTSPGEVFFQNLTIIICNNQIFQAGAIYKFFFN